MQNLLLFVRQSGVVGYAILWLQRGQAKGTIGLLTRKYWYVKSAVPSTVDGFEITNHDSPFQVHTSLYRSRQKHRPKSRQLVARTFALYPNGVSLTTLIATSVG